MRPRPFGLGNEPLCKSAWGNGQADQFREVLFLGHFLAATLGFGFHQAVKISIFKELVLFERWRGK